MNHITLQHKFANYFYCKTILWTPYVRIFCDGGQPRIYWFPRFRCLGYHSFWGMVGFSIHFWGRQFCFSFGLDKNGLYKE